jgi:hypothetical protein
LHRSRSDIAGSSPGCRTTIGTDPGRRRSPPGEWTAARAAGPFAIDTSLPAFDGIARSLQATPAPMQQTLSAYLFGFAVLNLFHGALSDSLGRRPVVLTGVGVFTTSSPFVPRPPASFFDLLRLRVDNGKGRTGRGNVNDTTQELECAPETGTLYRWLVGIGLGALAWVALYRHLTEIADRLVAWVGLSRETRLGEAVHFFFYDTPKVLLLLTGIVFVMGIVQTFFSPERTRALLSGKRLGVGNAMAAGLGIVTPFCSCSAVPLFIGFLSAGVPLGVTFSFLIAAPMVNEVALALLFGLFGWKVAALYLGMGLAVAIVAGYVIGELKMEHHLEEWVQAIHAGTAQHAAGEPLGWVQRFEAGRDHVREIVLKVWPYVLAGIALGAGIHGYVPQDFMASIMGRDAWWAVPVAVVLGVPMYTNAAGIIPIVEALIGKGAALGTVLAFMMSVIALSAPEMIILRKALKPRLIATFAGVVATGILLVGYVFNLVL